MFNNRLKALAAPMAICVAGALGAASNAAAQSTDPPRVDEIVVTAEKRAESLQDVPVSIVALPKAQLDNRGIDELKDFAANIPNLFVNNFNGSADTIRLFIRGLGQNAVEPTQDPSVALYIDGVYVGSAFGTGFELVDLERVEVLRGPQGTLYGRNATGGAINMITQRPDVGEWGFKQSFSGGNFAMFKSRSTINAPLGDDGGLKFAVLRSRRDGIVENRGPGVDFGIEDRWGARLDVRYDITPSFSFDYAFDASFVRDSAPYEQGISGPAAGNEAGYSAPLFDPIGVAGIGLVQPVGDYTFADKIERDRHSTGESARPHVQGDNEVYGHTMVLTYEASPVTTYKSITGYRTVDRSNFGDFAPYASGTISIGLPLPVLNQFGLVPVPSEPRPIADQADKTEIKQFTQEFQVLTDFQFWGGNTSLTAGLYFYADEIFQDASDSTTLEGPRAMDTTEAKNKAAAIFSQATWTPKILDERVHLTIGLRGSFDGREATRINENSFAFAEKGGFTATNCTTFSFFSTFISTATPCVPTGTVESSDYEKTFWNFNPAGTVEFDFSEDVNMYAKVVTGFKTGGTATRSANPENFAAGFDEEGVMAYELGLKGQFFDGRLQTNGALFYMQIDGFQTSIQTGATPGDRDFVGINDSKIYGMELDVVLAAYHGLFIRGSYGYLQTQLGVDAVTVLVSSGEEKTYPLLSDFSYAPNHSFSISLDYMATLTSQLDMTAYLGYNFQSEMITSPNLEDTGKLEARGLIDANITFFTESFGNGTTSIAFFGKNLLDEEYLTVNTSAFAFAGLDEQGSFGEPRTFGMTAKFEF